MISELVGA